MMDTTRNLCKPYCRPNSQYDFTQGICVDCKPNEWYNTTTQVCTKCPSNCESCEINQTTKGIKCLTCTAMYIVDGFNGKCRK